MASGDGWEDVWEDAPADSQPAKASANDGWEDSWEDAPAEPPPSNPVADEAAFRNAYALTQPDEPAPIPSIHPMPQAQSIGAPAQIQIPMDPTVPRGAHAAEFGDMDATARAAPGAVWNAGIEGLQHHVGTPMTQLGEKIAGEGANPLLALNPITMPVEAIANRMRNHFAPNVNPLLGKRSSSIIAGDDYAERTMSPERIDAARKNLPEWDLPVLGKTHPAEFIAREAGNPLNYVGVGEAGTVARGALESLPAFEKLATAAPRLAKVLAFTAEHSTTGATFGATGALIDPKMSVVEGAAGGALLGPVAAGAFKGVGATLKLTSAATRGFYNDLQMGLRLYAEDARELGVLFNMHAAVGDMVNPSGAMYAVDGNGRLILQLYKITDGKMELTPPLPVENRAQADLARKWLKAHGLRAVGASDEAKLKLSGVMTTEEIAEQLAPTKVALQDSFDLPSLDMSGPAAKHGVGVPNEPQFDIDVTGKPYKKPLTRSRQMTAAEQMDNAQTPDAVWRAGQRMAKEELPPLPPDPDVAPEQIGNDFAISIEQRPDGSAQITHAPEKPQPSVTAEKVRGKKGWLLKTITDSDGSQRHFLVSPDGTHTPVETPAPKPKRRLIKKTPTIMEHQRATGKPFAEAAADVEQMRASAAAPAPEPASALGPAPTPVEPVNPKSLTAEQRQALRDAGFRDSEIDKGYFDPKGLTGHVYTGGRMQPADDAYISQVRQDSGARVADAEEKLKQIQGKRGGLPPEEREALMGVDARENTYEEVRAELERRVEDGRQYVESRERQHERWKRANAAPAQSKPTPKKPYSKPLFQTGRKEGPELPPFIEMERAQTPEEVWKAGQRLAETEANTPANRPSREGLQAGDGTKESAPRQPGPPAPSGPKRFAIKKNSDGTFRLTDKQAPGGRWRITNHVSIDEAVNAAESILAKESPAPATGGAGGGEPPKPPPTSKGPPEGPPKPEMPPDRPLSPDEAQRAEDAKAVAKAIGMSDRSLFQRSLSRGRKLMLKSAAWFLGGHHYGFQALRDARRGLKSLPMIMAKREEMFRAIEQMLPRNQRSELMLGNFGKDIQKFIDNANDHLDWRDTDAYMQDHYPGAWPLVKDFALPAIEQMKRNSMELMQRFGRDPITEDAVATLREAGLWDAYSSQIYFAHMLKDDWVKLLAKNDPQKLENAAKYLLDKFHEWLAQQKNLTDEERAVYTSWDKSNAESVLRDILKTSNDVDETVAALKGHSILGKALDSVKSRHDLAEPIRQVLGPVDSALVRIPETLARQEWLIHNNNVWNNLIANNERLVSPVKRMGFSTEIPQDPIRYGNAGKPTPTGGSWYIADEAVDLLGMARQPDLGPITNALKVQARWAKAAMVPFGRLQTWMANYFGNPWFMVLAGVNPFTHPRQTGRAFDLAWDIINHSSKRRPFTTINEPVGSVMGTRELFEAASKDDNLKAALLKEARAYGVDEPGLASVELGGKKHARLLRMLQQEMRKLPPDATYWDRQHVLSRVADTANVGMEEVTTAYDSIDRTAKLMTYLYLREQGLKKFNGDVDKAARWAAQRIMDSFPSYTRMGKLVEAAGMAPGIFNYFVRFNTEVIRTTSMIPLRAFGVGREADPAIVARLALAYGAVAMMGNTMAHLRRMNGISDEEANALVENRVTQDKAWRPLVWVTPYRKSNGEPLVVDLTQFWNPAKLWYGLPQNSQAANMTMNAIGAFTDNSAIGQFMQKNVYEPTGMTDPQFQPDQPEVQRTLYDTVGDYLKSYAVPQGFTGPFNEFQKTKEFGPRDPQTGELLMSPYTEPNTLDDAILRTAGIPSVPLSTGLNSPGYRAASTEATQKGSKSIAREEQRIAKNRKLTEEEKAKQMEETPNTPRKLFFRQRAEDLTKLNERATEAKQKENAK